MRLHVQSVVIEDTQSLWNEIFDWLDKYREHEPDWADGYLAVLCSRNRKYKVWTYDIEFRTLWRRTNGSAIPLAIRTGPSRGNPNVGGSLFDKIHNLRSDP